MNTSYQITPLLTNLWKPPRKELNALRKPRIFEKKKFRKKGRRLNNSSIRNSKKNLPDPRGPKFKNKRTDWQLSSPETARKSMCRTYKPKSQNQRFNFKNKSVPNAKTPSMKPILIKAHHNLISLPLKRNQIPKIPHLFKNPPLTFIVISHPLVWGQLGNFL